MNKKGGYYRDYYFDGYLNYLIEKYNRINSELGKAPYAYSTLKTWATDTFFLEKHEETDFLKWLDSNESIEKAYEALIKHLDGHRDNPEGDADYYLFHMKEFREYLDLAKGEERNVRIGSPEWFLEESLAEDVIKFQQEIEDRRKTFLNKYSPEKLKEMNSEELLLKVFGDGESMRQELDFDDKYKEFGSTGGYKYLGVVYQEAGEVWKYKEKIHSNIISYDEARKKAQEVRDDLLDCVNIIKKMDLNTINDYEKLDGLLSKHFFYTYPWVLKYFQMVFPYYFPGMYADATLQRALNILGLPEHKKNRIVNAGEISLFIRRCNVNNIAFNMIYSKQWGWDSNTKPCESAEKNYNGRYFETGKIDYSLYELPESNKQQEKENLLLIEKVEKDLEELTVDGGEKEAVVKVRINQGIFRDKLLRKYGKCCLCGVSNKQLLIASHIKPWAASEANEKLDVNNGLLLCPNHDKLFDQGWISFDDEGNIIISDLLSTVDRVFMNVNTDMKITITEKNKKYMEYHRNKVFSNN